MEQQLALKHPGSAMPMAAWGAVTSMSLCVAVLIASEFLPVSLLSPIAADLGITEGVAGQAISISGIFAVLTSLFVAGLIRRIDRRFVITGFTVLLILSGTIVTMAPNYAVLMVGRVFLGVAIGGFWSMSTAVIMRLVPPDAVPRGLAMINAGNAISATISAPLGSLLGDYLGWRGAFFFVVPIAVLALVWQWISLPSLPPRPSEGSPNVFRLLARRRVALAMSATGLLFMGQFALFTYLRPFLETVTSVSVPILSLLLLLMGLASVLGTYLASLMLRARLFSVMVAIPLVMAGVALGLVVLGASVVPTALLLIAWGLFNPAAGMGWGAWLARCLPDDAEAGGGLQVATIQLAITIGAAGGGLLFDAVGWWSPFVLSAVLLCGSSLLAVAAWRSHQET
jgi:predicted MFS family arabinose efflux permease